MRPFLAVQTTYIHTQTHTSVFPSLSFHLLPSFPPSLSLLLPFLPSSSSFLPPPPQPFLHHQLLLLLLLLPPPLFQLLPFPPLLSFPPLLPPPLWKGGEGGEGGE